MLKASSLNLAARLPLREVGQLCVPLALRPEIEDNIRDHSARSCFRDSDIFCRAFEPVVGTCMAAGLVGGKGFAVDASLIVADANKQRSIPGSACKKRDDPPGAQPVGQDGRLSSLRMDVQMRSGAPVMGSRTNCEIYIRAWGCAEPGRPYGSSEYQRIHDRR